MITQAHAAVFLGMMGNTVRGNTRPLVAPMRLYGPTLTRAQASDARAVALGADGATWAEFGADAPRFSGTARRLLIEGQRTNIIANARTPGGTGWGNLNLASASSVGPDGVADSAFLLTEDTATGAHRTQTTAASNVTAGGPVTLSALVAPGTAELIQIYLAGAGAGTLAYANFDLTGSGAVGSVGASVTAARIKKDGIFYRLEMVITAESTAGVNAGIAFIENLADGRLPSFAGTSRTVTAAWVSVENAPFASTPILPPVATPAASTRSADIVTMTLASLGLPDSGAGTYLWSGVIGQQSPSGVNQTLFSVDDDTANNRFVIHNPQNTLTAVLFRSNGGAVGSAGSAGSFVAGTPFRVGVSIDGAGRVAASIDGGAVVAVSGGVTSGLTTLRFGNTSAGTGALFGEIYAFRSMQRVVNDAELPALVMGTPI